MPPQKAARWRHPRCYGNRREREHLPVAIGTAEYECVDAWTWFLQRVRTALCIGNGNGVVILSDMEKGIDNAVASLLPEASHALCLFLVEKTS